MTVFTQRGTLGAVRAQVDGRVKHRLLAYPDAVLDHGVHRTPHRAVGTHRAPDLDLAAALARSGRSRTGLFDQRQLRRGQAYTDAQPGAPQKRAAVHGRQRTGQAA